MINNAVEAHKIGAILEEVDAAFDFMSRGLKNLKEQKSSVSNNHVTIQLLSSGFERLVKILLLIKDKHNDGEYPELDVAKKRFSKYKGGHGIKSMLDELLAYSESVKLMQDIPIVKEDLDYLKSDSDFTKFIEIVTEFSISQRYFYIDIIASEKISNKYNPFDSFKQFILNFYRNIDTSTLSYEEEENIAIIEATICIEKGARALSRFFTHGFDSLGRQFYNKFSNLILLKDKDLGTLNYTENKINPSDTYKPITKFSLEYFPFIGAASKNLSSKDYPDWPFLVNRLKVYYVKPFFYCVLIDEKLFSLTGATATKYKLPLYTKSDKLKPKGYATYLLEEAQKLNR
ncbi:MAG: hypothetical protein HY062_06745 [Bacteroidetes bacterium]|nr:hypothetical protein [Bacteroidota bacterium]